VEVVVREPAAIDRALGLAGRGDLVIICGDQLERGWRQIEEFGTPAHARGDGAAATAASASAAGSATALGTAPAAEAVRAHPHDEAPAEDPAPPAPAPVGAAAPDARAERAGRPVAPADEEGPGPRLIRDTRGVVLARELND
jgi:hypothetical protein